MLKDNVLIRKVGGIETAGSMNILFTDKTGTLTYGKLEVVDVLQCKSKELLSLALRGNTSAEMSNGRAVGGNSTDRILLEYAQSLPHTVVPSIKSREPFSSAKKFMKTILSDGRVLKKGAPEVLIKGFRATGADRMIAVTIDDELVGIVVIKDQVRKESRPSIGKLASAGIQTVMITGDAETTARAVALECGIKGEVITSEDMKSLSDEDMKKLLPQLGVVARALPSDKSRLVKIAQSMNLVVGMTGDGVNDAPALKKADVGFAMGSGTEVAKEAGDIVIMDDNIGSITRAVSYGRTIFKSIRKFLVFKLIINFCAMAICIIAPLLHVDTPITVIQMLWINIVMDTLAGLAFGGEKPRARYMTEKPKKRDEAIINGYMWQQIIVGSVFTSLASLWFLLVMPTWLGAGAYFMTAFFMFFMFMNIFNSFNTRTQEINLLSYIKANKPFVIIMGSIMVIQVIMVFVGGPVFRTVPLGFVDFLIIILLALVVIPVDLIRKMVVGRKVLGV